MSAAFGAKAKVAMSHFEPGSSLNYEKMHENISIVRKRSAPLIYQTYTFSQSRTNRKKIIFCQLGFNLEVN